MLTRLKGQNVGARAMRSSAITIFNTGATNILRLLSNLILTRLLFPEAFGLMGLVFIVITGLSMFSDMGLRDAIMRQKTDDRNALNTLWTMQVVRGIILWALACALAWPAAQFYGEPQLLLLLPVAALSVLVDGFRSTKDPRATRDLTIGRLTILTVGAQVVGLVIMALLAWWLHSVWALAIGTVITAVIQVLFINFGMPGAHDRLGWDRKVVWETLGFGIFIFFSTIATFFVTMGSPMLLGDNIGLALFGIYNIANNLAMLPRMVAQKLAANVLFPLYRLKPPLEDISNQKKLFLARRSVGLFGIGISAFLGLTGDWLVNLLFDPRYETAGPILVLLGLANLPIMAFMGVQQSLVANGDSRRHLQVTGTTAALQMFLLVQFLPTYGVAAAIIIPAIASLITYPLLAVYVNRYKTWDARGELGLIGLALGLALLIGWLKMDAVMSVLALEVG